jgi:CMP-N,N'-diacetyllegionaminic acid synthase
MNLKEVLVVIPARKGSKGIPGKNKKLLNGKPLIAYTIEAALGIFEREQICISTDDEDIVLLAESYGISVPFIRPAELSTDTAGSQEVLIHAYEYYREKGFDAAVVCLLQATSPFRTTKHIAEAANVYSTECDMLVSVVESKANPYFNLMEESTEGFLEKSKVGDFKTRQEAPKVFELNGAIYFINTTSLIKQPISSFTKVLKYVMPSAASVDLDLPEDWEYATYLLQKKN